MRISDWSSDVCSSDLERRQAHLDALADGIHAHRDALALMDCLEMGLPIANALASVDEAVRFTRYYAAAITQPPGALANVDALHVLPMNLWQSRGVVGIISSWHFPLSFAVSAITPAREEERWVRQYGVR